MKNFSQFFVEAKVTSASTQAKRLGLVGNGHGDWYDRQGNLKAKTVKGKLVFFDGGQKSSKQDSPDQTERPEKVQPQGGEEIGQERPQISGGITSADVAARQQAARANSPMVNPPVEGGRALTVAFDKFDNQAVAENMFNTLMNVAPSGDFFIFPSRSADIKSLKEAYPDFAPYIIDDEDAETIFDVLQTFNNMGHQNINIVVRQSRAKQTEDLVSKYNGDIYNFSSINYLPVEERSVREQYLEGSILEIGSWVQNKNGEVGEIIRRGANHLICVTEEGNMFKSWIRDVIEL